MKSITRKQLHVAGWLSIASAIIGVPLFSYSVYAGMTQKTEHLILSVILSLVYTGIFIYIYSTFNDYLKIKHHFHDADYSIRLLIGINVIGAVLTILPLISKSLEMITTMIFILSLIPLGIIMVRFGVKLMNLKDDLFGLLKPLSYITSATGAFAASIILLPISLLFALVLDILLGIILLKAGAKTHK